MMLQLRAGPADRWMGPRGTDGDHGMRCPCGSILLLTSPRDVSRGGVILSQHSVTPQVPPGSAQRTQPLPLILVHVQDIPGGETGSNPLQTRLIPVVFQVAEPPAKEDAEICRTLLLFPEGTRSLPPGLSIWRPWRRRAVGALHAWCHPPVPTVGDTAPSHRLSRPLPADGLSRGQRDGAASNEYFMPSPTRH